MRLVKGFLLTSLVVAAIGAAAPSAAQAHDIYVFNHPSDPSGGRQFNNHFWLGPCDRQSDGRYTWIRYTMVDGGFVHRTANDPDGAGGECGREGHPFQVRTWTVCVSYEGCGPVIRHIGP